MKRLTAAFSLVELLVVISILSIISIALYVSYSGSRSNQAVASDAEVLANTLRQAHIYSRQSRESKSWGVVARDLVSYHLVSRTSVTESQDKLYQLDPQVSFSDTFEMWFDQGSGDASNPGQITLVSNRGKHYVVSVESGGIVEVEAL